MFQLLIKLIFLILVLFIGVFAWLWIDMQQFLEKPIGLEEQRLEYTVKPGMSLQAVANDLASMEVLDNPFYLVIDARFQGRASMIKAGEYQLIPGMTPRDLLDLLVEGKVILHGLTLVEGLNFRESMKTLSENSILVHTLPDLETETVIAALGLEETNPEGRLLPETYKFPAGTTDVQFIRRAWESLDRELQSAWESRAPDLPYESPYEALIMASIIEKETGQAGERAEIAGVFVRRLQKGMLLQTDPTVIYALGEDYDGNIRKGDLAVDNPYNTYVYPGLPPTPIAMPGKAAIEAALHPAEGTALYFVSRGDGSHVFSDTLKEHNRAVARYQLGGGR